MFGMSVNGARRAPARPGAVLMMQPERSVKVREACGFCGWLAMLRDSCNRYGNQDDARRGGACIAEKGGMRMMWETRHSAGSRKVGGPELAEEAGRICERRFRHADAGHPATQELRRMAERWCVRDLAAGRRPFAFASTQVTAGGSGSEGGGRGCAPSSPSSPSSPGLPELPELHDSPGEREDALDVLQTDFSLPSLPLVVMELQKTVDDPQSSAADVAAVVAKDAGLTAFLLRLVNSAFYSFPSQIDTISRAVAIVGTRQLGQLALGACVMDMFRHVPGKVMDLTAFWKHSIAVGMLSRRLAERVRLPEPERFFVCGLLHDIGFVMLCAAKPRRAAEVLRVAQERSVPLFVAEAEVMGFDHARLGGMLLRKWNFPFPLAAGVLHHHLPEKSAQFTEPLIVHVADVMAKALGVCATPEAHVPPLSPDAWDRAGLAPEDLGAAERGLYEVLEDMCRALLGG